MAGAVGTGRLPPEPRAQARRLQHGCPGGTLDGCPAQGPEGWCQGRAAGTSPGPIPLLPPEAGTPVGRELGSGAGGKEQLALPSQPQGPLDTPRISGSRSMRPSRGPSLSPSEATWRWRLAGSRFVAKSAGGGSGVLVPLAGRRRRQPFTGGARVALHGIAARKSSRHRRIASCPASLTGCGARLHPVAPPARTGPPSRAGRDPVGGLAGQLSTEEDPELPVHAGAPPPAPALGHPAGLSSSSTQNISDSVFARRFYRTCTCTHVHKSM